MDCNGQKGCGHEHEQVLVQATINGLGLSTDIKCEDLSTLEVSLVASTLETIV